MRRRKTTNHTPFSSSYNLLWKVDKTYLMFFLYAFDIYQHTNVLVTIGRIYCSNEVRDCHTNIGVQPNI